MKLNQQAQQKIRDALKRNGDTQSFTLVQKVTMLYAGWECDSDAWLVELADGTRRFILTDHGRAYVGSAKDLKGQIKANEAIVAAQREALASLQGT